MNSKNTYQLVILGAAGYVGQACLRAAVRHASEYETSILVRKPIQTSANIQQIIGDIRQFDASWLPKAPHVIVHLAVKQIDHDNTGFTAINVDGTRRILNNLNEFTKGVIYNSSMSVYGQTAQVNIGETADCNPTTALSLSRYTAEQLVLEKATAKSFSGAVLRPRFVIGQGDQFVLPKLKSLAQRKLTMNNGEPRYSVIHVDEYAEIIFSLVKRMLQESDACICSPYNIGYAEPLSLKEILYGLAGLKPNLSIPVHGSVLSALHRIPNKTLDQIATRLELIGLSHFGNTEKLQQLLNLPLLRRSPVDALKQAISEM